MSTLLRFLLCAAVLVWSARAHADIQTGLPDPPARSGPRSSLGTDKLRTIGVDQRLDQPVPLDLPFRDEHGEAVTLQKYFAAGRPVVLALVYYGCPMLCGQVMSGLASSVKTLSLDAGSAFEIVVVSFDPREKPDLAAAKKAAFLERYKRPGADQASHFLTGDQPAIEALTRAVGFRYEYDEKLGQYAHAAAIMVLTPDGRLARYFFGTEYAPRDLRFAIIEASHGKIGSLTDRLLLLCYHYDPQSGTYSATAIGVLRIAGAATVLVLFGFIAHSLLRERRRHRALDGEAGA